MKRIGILIIVATVNMYFMVACSNKKEEKQAEKTIPVKTMTVELSNTSSEKNYVGTVEESVAVSLSFSGMETVEQVLVSEGQRVHKGQLLAVLNTATAENSYKMMLAKQQQAQDAYDRLVKVHEKGSLPDIKFVEVETGLQQAKSMAAVAKKNLDDCRLYAPRDGVIAAANIEVGSNVMPSVAAFKLVSVDRVNVKIFVPENEISKIVEGQMAKIVVTALEDAVFTGKIEMKGVAANAMSHTYEVKIGIANPQKSLLPGMVCKVSIANANNETAEIVLPNRAVQISADNRHFVWLAENNVAHRRFVSVGNLTNTGIVVTEGLSAGDKVIIEGMMKVSEGIRLNCDFIND
ncbi:MAG: efflux RND transporter periplasmic adaptor subunit [Bacteroidales bacterium]|jgi:RND family efflux transporter MFP subunit|nr:efflux RND transporter periplasmic adaptor subunit [Bacteroidales bacterium]